MSSEEQIEAVEEVKDTGSTEETMPAATEKSTTAIPEEWGEDITEEKNKGVFKKILTPGSGSEKPMAGNEVIVHYTGRLLNGEVFDSSVDRNEKFKFKLGEGRVIKGWDVGVATMTRNEKCILTCTPDYAYGKNGSPPKIGPNETLQFEVELFDWRGEDVTADGGVIKYILTKGDTYSVPEDGSTVQAHIRGTYEGRVFQEGDVDFEYGEGSEKGVVSGVERAIGTMKVTETARIHVKPQYAYGEEGNADLGIPGGAELVYEVRLNQFTKAKEPWEYDTLEERLEGAAHLKERGGNYFKNGKFDLAKKLYDRAANLITDTAIRKEETKEQARPMRVALHLNIAACHLKLLEPGPALKECEEVLSDDAGNVKAFFRRGQAHQILQNFQEAMEAFQKVVELEPTNKAAKNQLIQTRNKLKQMREREKKKYANMFEKLAAASEKDEEAKKPEETSNATEEPSNVEATQKEGEETQEEGQSTETEPNEEGTTAENQEPMES